MDTYFTHDNGGRPFKVVVDKHKIDISVHQEEQTYKSWKSFTVEKTFIGKSPKIKMTEFSGGYGKKFDGNSILCKLKDFNYLFVGCNIYTFQSKAEIVKYVSPVGNNDVPYPYAVDKENNYYLMIENVMLKNIEIPAKYDNPYDYYYDAVHITPYTYNRNEPPTRPMFESGIEKYWSGEDQYNLTFNQDYDDNNTHYILKTGSIKKEKWKKEEYVSFMKSFGRKHGFLKIPRQRILHKRL